MIVNRFAVFPGTPDEARLLFEACQAQCCADEKPRCTSQGGMRVCVFVWGSFSQHFMDNVLFHRRRVPELYMPHYFPSAWDYAGPPE